jgi:hypothetical protein
MTQGLIETTHGRDINAQKSNTWCICMGFRRRPTSKLSGAPELRARFTAADTTHSYADGILPRVQASAAAPCSPAFSCAGIGLLWVDRSSMSR